jgi:hypothetical protein
VTVNERKDVVKMVEEEALWSRAFIFLGRDYPSVGPLLIPDPSTTTASYSSLETAQCHEDVNKRYQIRNPNNRSLAQSEIWNCSPTKSIRPSFHH